MLDYKEFAGGLYGNFSYAKNPTVMLDSYTNTSSKMHLKDLDSPE